MPLTNPNDRYARTNAMAAPAQPPNPWMTQPKPATQTAGAFPIPPLPGDPVGQPGYYPGQPAPGQMTSTPPVLANAPTGGGYQNPAAGNAMAPQGAAAYGPNGGGLRVNPNYLPEQWDYKQSPEYQQRLQWAQRDLNRQLLSMGRSDSTGGINAMARQQGEIAGQEIDKQYQRAIQANMENARRMFGANVENYGRTRGEDQTGWDRAAYLDNTADFRAFRGGEQDWGRNWQLANMGLNATNTGVNAGNQAGANLANLLNENGATQAGLALRSGAISADQIQSLLNAGWTYMQIEQQFGNRGGGGIPSSVPMPGLPGNAQLPSLPGGQVPSWMNQPQPYSGGALGQYSGMPSTGDANGGWGGAYDFFAEQG